MAECQHIYGGIIRLMAVKGQVTGISETDDQFTQVGVFGERTADIRRGFQLCESPFDRCGGAFRRLRRFRREETTAAVQASNGAARDDYPWHSGGSASASVPQVFSQARTSCPVRCSPVS